MKWCARLQIDAFMFICYFIFVNDFSPRIILDLAAEKGMDVDEIAKILSALKNPERLFGAIRQYIKTHSEVPSKLMAAARRAFTEEYDREFGDDDFSAEMGELGI